MLDTLDKANEAESSLSGSPSRLVTVVVPALNEEATIEQVINAVLALPLEVQLVVVDDGSTDQTAEILNRYRDRIEVVTHARPQGKGNAIRAALPLARGKATIIQDADLEYDPQEIPKIVGRILTDDANVVFGSRFFLGLPAGMALPNKLVNILLPLAVRLMYKERITDEATCYKAFRTDLLKRMDLECARFEFCPETVAKTLRMGERIEEVPISYVPRHKSAGKKIRWTDAPEAFWTLWRYRNWRESRVPETGDTKK